MKGKITKFKAWKSNKGCFIGIDNGEADYLYNKLPKIRIGDEVEYDTGKPTEDGKPTLSKLVLIGGDVEAFVDEDKPRSATVYQAHDQPQWQKENDRERAKFRLDCVRIAVEAFSDFGGTQSQEDKIIEMAAKFEDYAKNGKVKA